MSWDLVLVGGGLSNSLIALRLAELRPEWNLCVIESEAEPAGNHTWSFHRTDVPESVFRWLEPLLSKSWDDHEVLFPKRRRRMRGSYHSIRAEDLARRLKEKLGDSLRCGARAIRLAATEVTLDSGERLKARAVLDGRGFIPGGPRAYQKFLGQDLELKAPHGLTRPIIMDATVQQRDGYRFFYLLPWDEKTLLVEDTRYSDGPEVAVEESRMEIAEYVGARGWRIAKVLREEVGSLPIPLTDEGTAPAIGAAAVGVRAGLFHPTTGYSLPEAARFADAVAGIDFPSSGAIGALAAERRRRQTSQWNYLRLLNRMLFQGAEPAERRKIFERFYGLSQGCIERFYAGRLSALDKARILVGRPPIPISRALECVKEKKREQGVVFG